MNPDATALVVVGLLAWLAIQMWAKPKRTPISGWITKGRRGMSQVTFWTKKKKAKKGRKR